MTCPECNSKISAKHYDADFEMYECPKCGGMFTVDEMEDTRGDNSRNGGGGSNRGSGSASRVGATKKAVAKGKKRQTEIDADEEAIEKFEAEQLKVRTSEKSTHHRDEIPTKQVVSIMADELEEIYKEFGGRIDRTNALDKALTLWRQMSIHEGISAREKTVEHVLCKDHS